MRGQPVADRTILPLAIVRNSVEEVGGDGVGWAADDQRHRHFKLLRRPKWGTPGHGQAMDERELRGLFTEIGCIMENTSVTALVWQRDDARSILARAVELRDAYNRIGALLDAIDLYVR